MAYYFRSFLNSTKKGKKEFDANKALKQFCNQTESLLPEDLFKKYMESCSDSRPEEFLQCLGDAMRDLKMQYEAFVQLHQSSLKSASSVALQHHSVTAEPSKEKPKCEDCQNEKSIFRSNKECGKCSKSICNTCSKRICLDCVLAPKNVSVPKLKIPTVAVPSGAVAGPAVPVEIQGPPGHLFTSATDLLLDEKLMASFENVPPKISIPVVPITPRRRKPSLSKQNSADFLGELQHKIDNRSRRESLSMIDERKVLTPRERGTYTPSLIDDLKNTLGKRRKTMCSTEPRRKHSFSRGYGSIKKDDLYNDCANDENDIMNKIANIPGLSQRLKLEEVRKRNASPDRSEIEWK